MSASLRSGRDVSAPGRARGKSAEEEQLVRERRSQVRGLVLLAVAAIVFSIHRFGVHRVFTPGWWRLW